jgi:FMN phosphatase YigB (HAD superfamily)
MRRVKAVVFDVGETLIDETGMWERAAGVAGVPAFTLMGVLGGLAARGEHHDEVWGILGVPRASSTWTLDDLYQDAVPCIEGLRRLGLRACAVGNTPEETEELLGGVVEVLGSSERWGVAKPSPAFFARVIDAVGLPAGEVAYVGDRVDNDVRPARGAGMVAVHIRRGPWGYLQSGSEEADLRIASLADLPTHLIRVDDGRKDS